MGERRAIGAATIAEAFRLTVEDNPDRIAVRTLHDEVSYTWAQLRDEVDALAGGLHRLGVRRGDTVALMISNRPEFMIADLAVMTLGATPFSIYLTSAPDQVRYVIGDAAARVAIVEEPFVPLVTGLVEHVLTVGDWPRDPGFDAEPHWRAVEPDDILTLIYTSGTTGPPKGVQIAHRNQMAAVDAVEQRVGFPDDSRVISWLPSAHVAERTAHHYLPIVYAMTITTCPDPRQIGTYLPAVKPTWFFAVPRVWEKLKAGVEAKLGGDEQAMQLLAAGAQAVELQQAGQPVPPELQQILDVAEPKLFAPLRAAIGLDEAKLVNVGAAPTPREVLVFFHAIGIPLAEIWGMSETCGAGASNPGERIKIGTVGLPSPGVELKLADDGELLARSKVVMVGYRNLPEQHRRGARRRRLAAHRRRRDDRRRRLRDADRPQEGADHQRRRQEHVAGQHRGDAQGRLGADRTGVRDRRRPPLQHGAARARSRRRPRVGRSATASRAIWPRSRATSGSSPRSRRTSMPPTGRSRARRRSSASR